MKRQGSTDKSNKGLPRNKLCQFLDLSYPPSSLSFPNSPSDGMFFYLEVLNSTLALAKETITGVSKLKLRIIFTKI